MTQHFFTKSQIQEIKAAIQKAEQYTSGEIRVHISKKLKHDTPQQEAQYMFERLKMRETKLRNGILFLLCPSVHQFAVFADKGIHEKVEDNFWHEIVEVCIQEFKDENFVEGLKKGILKCSEKLKAYFPTQKNDQNELSNEISYD